MRELERRVLLTVLDRKWREHLYEMDYLREGIGLRAMAQRDPLVEYQREGGDMFNLMMEAFMEEVVGFVFHLEVQVTESPQVGVVTDADGAPVQIGAAGRNGKSRPERDRTGRVRTRSGRPRGRGARARRGRRRGRRSVEPEEPGAPRPPRPPAAAAKGLDAPRRTGLSYSAPDEDGSVKTAGQAGQGRRPVRGGRPQRAVPVRVRQEVQDVPRPPRRRRLSRGSVSPTPAGDLLHHERHSCGSARTRSPRRPRLLSSPAPGSASAWR